MFIAPHALLRMGQRGFTYLGIKRALSYAIRAVASGTDRWEIHGRDDDGTDRKIIVVIEDNAIVVSVM